MIYFCCDQFRRNQLVGTAFNGIDYLEVLDHEIELSDPANRQKRLVVHLINDLAPNALSKTNIQIEGGERIQNIAALDATVDGADAKALNVLLDKYGDFSIYTLRLVQNAQNPEPPPEIDPLFGAVDFSFKVDCPSEFDCQPRCDCPPAPRQEPEIDYLAKDYASFRRLMFDRMSVLMPEWRERNAADLGVALVELLAYAGDHLSYQQDAVATEAYLGTARRRVSVRRHARLVDYAMHDGCNARAWVQVQVNADVSSMVAGTQVFTRIPGQAPVLPDDPILRAQAHEIFETMETAALFAAHNEMHFYSWGDQRCCLSKGATQATLRGSLVQLKAGDVVIFEEVVGPNSGRPEDADPAHRCAVRLTHVVTQDAADQPLTDPLTGQMITQIIWAGEDALPLPLCLSAQTDSAHGGQFIEPVSVARGNIVLADHGFAIDGETLGAVPLAPLSKLAASSCERCEPKDPAALPVRFRPRLKERSITFATRYGSAPLFGFTPAATDADNLDDQILAADLQSQFAGAGVKISTGASIQGERPFWSISDGLRAFVVREEQGKFNVYGLPVPATGLLRQEPRAALPAVTLHGKLNLDETHWTAVRDLLDSGAADAHFVAEIEDDGTARLRFGDGKLGLRPQALTAFDATYRVGNGAAGNVGAEAIAHLFSADAALGAAVSAVRNPLAAEGGFEPESVAQVRAYAPEAFRTQERAVTEADYAEVTERHPGVQRAVATFRWTGSWHTVFITVDRLGGLPVDGEFEDSVRAHVERYRMAGHDLEIDGPLFVALEIDMYVCVEPDYFREDVKGELLDLFSRRALGDGRVGMFHPDNFTFGQTVYLSPLIAAAQAVQGVMSVQVDKFQRQGRPDNKALAVGKLELGRLEIARCDNDPNFAERGVFHLLLGGGK
jgi:Baseplate J-like protein